MVEEAGGPALRGPQGNLLASGPALVFVLHIPIRCGSRTSGLEFAAGSFHAGKLVV